MVKVRKRMNAPSLPTRHQQTNGKTGGHPQQNSHQWVPPDGEMMGQHQGRIWCRNTSESPTSAESARLSSCCWAIIPMLMKEKIFTNPWTFSAALTYRWRKITSGASETRDWAADAWFEWDKSVLQPRSGDQTAHSRSPSGDAQRIFICTRVNI